MNADPLTAEGTVNDWTIDTSKPDGIRVIDSKGNVRGRYADMRQLALYGVLTMQEADQLRATLAEREREVLTWKFSVLEKITEAQREAESGGVETGLVCNYLIESLEAICEQQSILSRAVGSGEGTSQEGEPT